MDFFFHPQGIALSGATPNASKGGNAILKNLIRTFKGSLYPVNPKYSEIEGMPCYPSIRDIPGPADLAIVFVPARDVLPAVQDCIARGIRGVIIQSGGFGETGPGGRDLQMQLTRVARESGIRLWGPNCMGLVDAFSGHIFSFMAPGSFGEGIVRGGISLVVQSGLLSAGFLLDVMSHGIAGFSKVCSIGNKIDVNECDLLPYLLADPHTGAVGLYLESILEGRRFIEICRKSDKPIVVLKGGKSSIGARAAMSHTASLAGNHRVIEGVLAQAGVIEAVDFREMVDLCRSLALYPARPPGEGRTAILTFSGGAGIVAVDFIEQFKLTAAQWSDDTRGALQKLFPEWMPVSNPADLWPAMERHMGTGLDVNRESLNAVIADPGVDAVLVSTFAGDFPIFLDLADAAARSRKSGKPIFVWITGQQRQVLEFQKKARDYGVPVFQELHRAVECMAAVLNRRRGHGVSEGIDQPDATDLPPDLDEMVREMEGPLDEHLSKRYLQACGIPTVKEIIVEDIDSFKNASEELGFPLVMKGLTPGGIHKTEMGLVRLNIQDKDGARLIFRELMKRMNGEGKVLLQRQVAGKVELILGFIRDPQFGPCVMFGLGGVMAEIFQDTAFAMAPLTREDALGLISRIKGQKLLDGFRGAPPVNREALAGILSALGGIGLRDRRIKEIDINPLMITSSGAVAVDATIILEKNVER